MSKIIIARLLLSVLSLFILCGSFITTYVLLETDSDSTVEVRISENEPTIVEFESLGLSPGEKCEYTVELYVDALEPIGISLDFKELYESPMKNYVYVSIEVREETVYRSLLADCLDGEEIILDYEELDGNFKIIYSMPSEVGNEAQNTDAHFELLVAPIV